MDTQQPHADGESATKYLAEKRKVRILGSTTVVACLVAVGAAAWGLGNADSSTGTVVPGTGQSAPQPMPGRGGFTPGGPAPGATSDLFDSDGNVDEQALAQLLDSIPDGDLQGFLQRQVHAGLLTQDQADALAAAAAEEA